MGYAESRYARFPSPSNPISCGSLMAVSAVFDETTAQSDSRRLPFPKG